MTFPADIKQCMKDCILAIIWPREDILRFFTSCGCTSSDLKCVSHFKADNISRHKVIDMVFDSISSRDDGGLGQFRAMLKSLLEWSHFDDYYFGKLAKLDRSAADNRLNHLRQLQEIRDANLKKERARILENEKKAMMSRDDLGKVRENFISLFSSSNAQRRGYEFEAVLRELSRLSGLETTEAFCANGEQIDGAVKYDGEHYIVEAKWHDASASNEPLYQFAAKVEGKMYARGIFISVNGYSENVVKSLVIGKAIKVILVDGGDITLIVEGLVSFAQMLDRKVKAAQTKGLIYVDPITGKPKIH